MGENNETKDIEVLETAQTLMVDDLK